jgi:hypothetical protein
MAPREIKRHDHAAQTTDTTKATQENFDLGEG